MATILDVTIFPGVVNPAEEYRNGSHDVDTRNGDGYYPGTIA